MNEWAVKKAKLLASPPLHITAEDMPRFLEVSSTGPGAGSRSVFLNFGGHRVIKPVSSVAVDGAFSLRRRDGEYSLISPDGTVFIDGVRVERSIIHAPEQAFLNIEQRCIFNCMFCTSSAIKNRTRTLSDRKILAMLEDAVGKGARSVALTSGVWPDISGGVERIARILSQFHRIHLDITLGAEVYTENISDLRLLKDSGVSELKLNVEVVTRGLCEKLCPEKDFEAVHTVLEGAVSVFGRGMVTSNIIYGFGETDNEVLAEAERLADMGVVPYLRALRLTDNNKTALEDAGINPAPVGHERMLGLAYGLREILQSAGMPLRFKTMCYACRACDIHPLLDLE